MTDQVDMSQFIAARSDQLNADDLMDNPRTITITKVTASPDSAEQPVSIHYQGGEGRPFKPCKTMRRIMVAVWGKDASQYVGRSMTLYRDPDVQFGGMKVGGIRVSHMSHLPEKKTVALLVTRGRKAPYTVHPLAAVPPAATDESRTKAENWVAGFTAELGTFNADGQRALFEKKASAIAKLEREYPDLYQKVTALKPAADSFEDDDFTAGEPADEAGPDAEDERESGPATDPQTNDLLGQYDQQPQQKGDDPAATKANEIIGELKNATSIAEITAIIGRNAVHQEALGELWQTVLQVKDARLAELKAEAVGAK